MAQRRKNYNKRNHRRNDKSAKEEFININSASKPSVPHNDPDWYIYDQEMFKGVIQMPTLEFKGAPISWNMADVSLYGWDQVNANAKLAYDEAKVNKLNSTNVVAYHMNPAIPEQKTMKAYGTGHAPLQLSAVNVAARKMYAELSSSNAKTSGYAPQDISTLILALGQVIAMVEHLRRIYGTYTYFDFYNRSIPVDILAAMGVNNADLSRKDLANIRARVNKIISQIDTIQFPMGLNYFKKCKYIYQNIFVDRDEKMTTYQLMTPYSTWILDEESFQEGTILKTSVVNGLDVDHLMQLVEDMINNILTSSTFNFIFADIINLANRNVLTTEIFDLPMIAIDYVITPLYSEQFNWQVMNMSIMPIPNGTFIDELNTNYGTPNNDVYPDVDSNIITYAPYFRGTYANNIDDFNHFLKVPPVRLPDTNVSHEQFVELLAYTSRLRYNNLGEPRETGFRMDISNPTDYYCVTAKIVRRRRIPNGEEMAETINYRSNMIKSSNFSQLVACQELVHFPFISMSNDRYVEFELRTEPISRLSAFTQVDDRALRNLRYETFLGLFTFKK